MTNRVRIGIVGCGEVAQIIHLPSLRDLGDLFEVTALCDISPKVLDSLGAALPGARRYGDYRDLLAGADIDAVLIANPHVYHAEVAMAAMRAGKHVLIEKPMCITLEEADQMLAVERESGVIAQVGFMRRHAPAYKEAVDLVRQVHDKIILARVHDVIGRNALVIESTSRVVRGTDVPAGQLDATRRAMAEATHRAVGVAEGPLANAYGLLLGLSSHDISAMRELIGMPREVLHATLRGNGRVLTAAFDYGHFVCQFQTAVDDIPHFDGHLEVNTPNEIIRIDYDTPYIRHLPATLTVTRKHGEAGRADTSSHPTRRDSFVIEWRDFHDNIVNRRAPKTSIADARQDLVLFKRMTELMA